MKAHERRELLGVVSELTPGNGSVAVVLIGSVARNCETPRSDIDILIVGETEPNNRCRFPEFEFHRHDETKFLLRLHQGDDFPNWCMRFGVPLSGHEYWSSILSRAGHAAWPEWKRKIEIAARRWVAAELSLKTNDEQHASEWAVFAYDHLIRGLLLREGIFPLSRPELAEQVRAIAPELGVCLSSLLSESPHGIDWSRVLWELSQTIRQIDSALFEESCNRVRKFFTGKTSSRPRTEASGATSG